MIIKDLEKILRAEFPAGLNGKVLDPDEDLLVQGIIDSMGLMKLIDAMEKTFGIHIIDEEIVPDNFQCLNSMVGLIEQQMRTN